MKRIFVCLCAVLMLCGCTQETKQVSEPTTIPTEPTGSYLADHEIQTQTGGALRAYAIGGSGMQMVSDGIAVWNEQGQLTVYEVEEGKILHQATLKAPVLAVEDTQIYYETDQICCYDYQTGKTKRWSVPAEIQGQYVLGTQTREIYYCTTGEIHGLSLETGITRLIKTHNAQEQSLTGAYLGGEVLGWKTENGMAYLSSQDGSLLSDEQGLQNLETRDGWYLTDRQDGMANQLIVGSKDTAPMLLDLPREQLIPAFAMDGILQLTPENNLCFYDLTSGKKTAQIPIPGETAYKTITAAQGYIWILTENLLYRWQMELSPVTEDRVYTQPVPTAEDPDTDGMTQCRNRIQELEQFHGVSILVGADALEQLGGHTVTPEYQVTAIDYMLRSLTGALEPFPQNFVGSSLASGKVSICLVREIDSDTGYDRFWIDGNYYILVDVEADMTQAILYGLGGAIDSHILGHSRDLEYWNQANPSGFSYLADAPVPENYAQYVGSYFVDERAMSQPNEDRAWLLYYAMTPDHGEMFAQTHLQKKLKMVCEGIREAYDLKDSPDTYLWEQYLQ